MNKQIDLNIFLRSKFRSKFQLDRGDLALIESKGIEAIRSHAYSFIQKRLATANPRQDGKQTPFKGHPVFKAQHATATCCRGCLEKWHEISREKALTNAEIDYVVLFIMRWIDSKNTLPSSVQKSPSNSPHQQLSLFNLFFDE